MPATTRIPKGSSIPVAQDLQQFVQALTTNPGVYQMYTAQDVLIYVGKARDLKSRVSSYFRDTITDRKTLAMIAQVVRIEVIVTDTENEALLLESNLIKRHRPRYNVLLRDDKSYPYLYLSSKQQFPKLDFHRGARSAPGHYFGPYPNAGAVRDNLALVQKLFQLRQCSDSFFSHRTRPCLQYQIKRCTAPCVGYVSEADYALQVKQALLFLNGKNEEVMEWLGERMEEASANQDYERAAHYRDQISQLRQLQMKQAISGGQGNVDVLGVAMQADQLVVSILFVRAGRVIGHRAYFPKLPLGTDKAAALNEFIPQYYSSPLRGATLAERIVMSEVLPDKSWIQAALQEQTGSQLQIIDTPHAKYRAWQQLAQKNAEYTLSQHLGEQGQVDLQLTTLQAALSLPNPLQRIECFDISHSLGEATVASCVVFTEQGLKRQEYRRFNIEGITPGDDYAAMKQALLRRYTRVKSSDGVLPDLLIIDGGKGQLTQAALVMEELQISGVMLLGVAKGPTRKAGLEQLWVYGQAQPIDLPAEHMALHVIQLIRDEAHRFAISAHRQQRAKQRRSSELEHIAGVGAKRRQALLKHFGGLQLLRDATVADIAKVAGISPALAERIYAALHEG